MGFSFFLLGLSGSLDLVVESSKLNARLINGSPGVVFIVVGFLILWRYRPRESRTLTEEKIVQRVVAPHANATRSGADKSRNLLSESTKLFLDEALLQPLEKVAPGITELLTKHNLKSSVAQLVRQRPAFQVQTLETHSETHRTSQTVDRGMLSGS